VCERERERERERKKLGVIAFEKRKENKKKFG
jgi:hypothetical protein